MKNLNAHFVVCDPSGVSESQIVIVCGKPLKIIEIINDTGVIARDLTVWEIIKNKLFNIMGDLKWKIQKHKN